ncbi:hypothetical protein [Fischerella thermalis]|uniref:Uncharacterized protein n=2 Tax=Fischerella thermalis TaxID=372787 RepID=A0A2N6KGX9_9CYAN|nr:hypothetical protein [Fischerella thermalis]PLZ66825.1 hypothetical protein CBP21_18290 [Fischerella thermalis WC246]PMB09620.1 hypothetical protein CEN49_06225 [Fischerella thermalis CCMEE 5273]PLZ06314.1 hypothetical protein CBP19_20935 [Fischerella thermalis WC1110]PLZ12866.1 hypothetical protein CBP17_06405 [Fischerella thermalis WC114]PLZ14327.1 hypothetical protein CBP18_02700 [Fischerella thermalis WC119]
MNRPLVKTSFFVESKEHLRVGIPPTLATCPLFESGSWLITSRPTDTSGKRTSQQVGRYTIISEYQFVQVLSLGQSNIPFSQPTPAKLGW